MIYHNIFSNAIQEKINCFSAKNNLLKYGIRNNLDNYQIYVPYLLITPESIFRVINRNLDFNNYTIIFFSHMFDEIINAEMIPSSVKIIIFGNRFNKPLDNLPSQIEIIIFHTNSMFNQKLDNLPINLRGIILGKNFKQSLDLLPPSIEFIDFPYYLDKYYMPPFINC
jgi:hypothetical protein